MFLFFLRLVFMVIVKKGLEIIEKKEKKRKEKGGRGGGGGFV